MKPKIKKKIPLLPMLFLLILLFDLFLTYSLMKPEALSMHMEEAWHAMGETERLILVSTYLFSAAILTTLLLFDRRCKKLEKSFERSNEKVSLQDRQIGELKKEIEQRLYVDPLTETPNGNALKKRLSDPHHNIKYLIHLDIDAFHEINELYGDATGDELLRQLADLLTYHFKKGRCTIYRLRSDEFIVAGTESVNRLELDHVLSLLVSTVNNHRFASGSDSFHIAIRAGASLEREQLLTTAGMALKCAKSSYRSYCIYAQEHDLTEIYRSNLSWIREMKRALEEDRVILHYQPIVRVADNSINAYECLVRIVDREEKIHYPVEFLDLAKRSKIYFDITMRVVDKAFASFKEHPAHFSINLSYDDIANGNIMHYIIEKVRAFPEPHRIHFEILECDRIENYDIVRHVTDKLRHMGCAISLDDFGSGYSNFEHILQLDIDMLKIDGSLIKNIIEDDNSRLIVETIIDFAKRLDLDTCVEFVSNKEIYDLLKSMGVTYMQGFYLSKPKPYH